MHCNVNRMTIGQGITVQVAPYDGTNGGSFEVYAEVRLKTIAAIVMVIDSSEDNPYVVSIHLLYKRVSLF